MPMSTSPSNRTVDRPESCRRTVKRQVPVGRGEGPDAQDEQGEQGEQGDGGSNDFQHGVAMETAL